MSSKEDQLAALGKLRKESNKGRIAKDSKSRLKKISHKKFRTCFIYALSEFENTFGLDLWGHNLPDDDITSQQKANRMRWDKVRKNILDKGNAQSRAIGMELDLYDVEFKGYQINCGGIQDG